MNVYGLTELRALIFLRGQNKCDKFLGELDMCTPDLGIHVTEEIEILLLNYIILKSRHF